MREPHACKQLLDLGVKGVLLEIEEGAVSVLASYFGKDLVRCSTGPSLCL